ncbi:T9SS type A sorting domain-containing protein [Lacibacter sp. H407]|uniref:T9SS type A sorting domain-containing protein n=1 Tax=Lacibacter sp. H407 TaxID=3133423 RepID=UPI0030C41F47
MIRKLLLLLVVTTILQNTSYGQQADILANAFYDNANNRVVVRLAIRNNTATITNFEIVGICIGLQYHSPKVSFAGYKSYFYNNGNQSSSLNDASFLAPTFGADSGPNPFLYIGPDPGNGSVLGVGIKGGSTNQTRDAPVATGGTKTMQMRFFQRSTSSCTEIWPVPPHTYRLMVDFYFTLVNIADISYYKLNQPGYGFDTDEFIAQGLSGHSETLKDNHKDIAIVLIRNANPENAYQPFDLSNCNGSNVNPVTIEKDSTVKFITPINGILAGKAIEANVQDKDNHVLVQWKSEYNQLVDYFEVQRKDGNGEFKTVGLVMGKEGTEAVQYEFKDKITARDIEPSYRIKVINNDKVITYSDVRKIRLGSEQNVTVKVFPNPSSESLRINLPVSNGMFVCRMYSTEGRMVQVTNVSAANPTVNIKTLQTGSYFMELYQPQTGKRYYTQFSKQ